MEVTEVRVALREPLLRPGLVEGREGERRLKAYVTVTFDHCFVVRHLKVIEGKSGLFVAMPADKPKVPCDRCRVKNELGGRYCAQCGSPLSVLTQRMMSPHEGETHEAKVHRDIAHPITLEFRQHLQRKVLEAYDAERIKACGQETTMTSSDETR